MFAAIDVKCARKVRLLEFVTFFLTLYDKKLRSLCEEHTGLAGDVNEMQDSILKLTSELKEKKQIRNVLSTGVLIKVNVKEIDDAILKGEKELNQLINVKNEVEEAMVKVYGQVYMVESIIEMLKMLSDWSCGVLILFFEITSFFFLSHF
jgi:hypothetical protein